jgi:hypothetical protein
VAHGIPARLSPAEGRKFGLTVGAAFAVLAAVSWWREHPTTTYIFGALAAGLLIAGLVVPGQLGPVYRGWMKFALLISKVTTPIFMGIVFFIVIMPIGLLMRLFGRNPVHHKAINKSYWAPRANARGDLTHQF